MRRCSCLLVATVAGAAWVTAAHAAGAETPYPDDAAWVVSLDGAMGDGRPLELHLAVRGGKLAAAVATAPRFNAPVHDVDISGLRLAGRRLTGRVGVTINPDNYQPADGKPIACTFRLDCAAGAAGPAGTYEGAVGGRTCGGAISGRLEPHYDPAAAYSRLKLRFLGALVRLFLGRGPNRKYALDMNMTLPVRAGKIGTIRFETIVPDYRRYSAVVQSDGVRFDGHALSGTVTAQVDYGGQGAGKDAPAGDTYVYTLHGTVIGQTVGGTYDAAWDGGKVSGYRFVGTADSTPPPRPAESIATMRLFDAMGPGAPVLLTLSLVDDGLINGFAYAPAYNHEVHAVDASALRLEGGRLRGPVKVSISPDCYRPPEHFDMNYRLDATISDEQIAGNFTGNDGKRDVKGAISGELRAKRRAERPVTMQSLARCVLDLRYCLVTGPMPKKDWQQCGPNHLNVIYEVRRGNAVSAAAVNPSKADLLKATVTGFALDIRGDRLTGTVRFEHDGSLVKGGTYEYTFEAIVDGDACMGYWRGKLDGKGIYVKSAKLSGGLTTAP